MRAGVQPGGTDPPARVSERWWHRVRRVRTEYDAKMEKQRKQRAKQKEKSERKKALASMSKEKKKSESKASERKQKVSALACLLAPPVCSGVLCCAMSCASTGPIQ